METMVGFLSFTECTYGNDDKHDFKKKMAFINHNAFMGLYSLCKLFWKNRKQMLLLFFFWFCWSHIITKWFQPLFNEHGEWRYSCLTFFKLWRQSDDLFNSFINFTFKSIIIKICKSKLMFSWTFLLFLACLYGSSTSKNKTQRRQPKGKPTIKRAELNQLWTEWPNQEI